MLTMCGCPDSLPIATCSRTNRSRLSASRSVVRTFTATVRSSALWLQRYTTPNPPCPISSGSSKPAATSSAGIPALLISRCVGNGSLSAIARLKLQRRHGGTLPPNLSISRTAVRRATIHAAPHRAYVETHPGPPLDVPPGCSKPNDLDCRDQPPCHHHATDRQSRHLPVGAPGPCVARFHAGAGHAGAYISGIWSREANVWPPAAVDAAAG